MRETTLERKLRVEIKRRGGRAAKFSSPGWAGAPDRIVLMPGGRLWFVELKAPGRKPRPLQMRRLDELQALGFAVRIIGSAAELDRFLAEVDRYAVSTS